MYFDHIFSSSIPPWFSLPPFLQDLMFYQLSKKVKISVAAYLLPTIPFSFYLFQPSKMLKERKDTGEEGGPNPHRWEETGGQKGVESFEKRP